MQQHDWDDLKQQMASPYGYMKLKCDQYEVTLEQRVDSKGRKWETWIFVDGVIKGEWCKPDENGNPMFEETRRFLRKSSKAYFRAKEVEQYRKAFGKRRAAEIAAKRHIWFNADWNSFNSLKKHLLANNTSIERIH